MDTTMAVLAECTRLGVVDQAIFAGVVAALAGAATAAYYESSVVGSIRRRAQSLSRQLEAARWAAAGTRR